MADRKQPSGLAIWLGIADNTFTRQSDSAEPHHQRPLYGNNSY